MALSRVRKLRRSTRLLQLSALMLLGLGALCFLPLPSTNSAMRITFGLVTITSGSAGVVGLAFQWYRALITFTTCSWIAALIAIGSMTQLIMQRPVQINPFPWIIWVASVLLTLPPSILSSTMHILKVWRPQPMVGETTAPLVAASADSDLPPPDALEPAAPAAPSRPVWPPPPPRDNEYVLRSGHAGPDAPAGGDATKSGSAGPPAWPPRVD